MSTIMPRFHRAIAVAIATSLKMGIIVFSMYIAQEFPLYKSDSDVAKKWVQNPFLSNIAIAISNCFHSVEVGLNCSFPPSDSDRLASKWHC